MDIRVVAAVLAALVVELGLDVGARNVVCPGSREGLVIGYETLTIQLESRPAVDRRHGFALPDRSDGDSAE